MKRLLIGLLLVVPVGLVAINRCKVKKITQADVGGYRICTSGSGRYVQKLQLLSLMTMYNSPLKNL